MTSTEINLNVSHCNDCNQDVDLLHNCSIDNDEDLLAALLRSPEFSLVTFPEDITFPEDEGLTNEEFREVHGEPCQHLHGDHLDYAVNGDPDSTISVFECRDCGLVL